MADIDVDGDYLVHDHVRVARIVPGLNASARQSFVDDVQNIVTGKEINDARTEMREEVLEALEKLVDECDGLVSFKEISESINNL